MIETKDIFENNLFDDLIKDSITLAKALEEVEVQFKDLAKTTGKLETKDVFKSYDKVKTLEKDISSLEVAVKGLTEVEGLRNTLVKESIVLTKKYEEELATIAEQNKEITESLNKETIAITKDNSAIVKLNNTLATNIKRQNVIVNSLKAVESFKTKDTRATVGAITKYRTLNTVLEKTQRTTEELQRELAGVKIGNNIVSAPTKVNKLSSAFQKVKGAVLKAKNSLFGFDNSLNKTEVETDETTKKLTRLQKVMRGLKSLGGSFLSGAAFESGKEFFAAAINSLQVGRGTAIEIQQTTAQVVKTIADAVNFLGVQLFGIFDFFFDTKNIDLVVKVDDVSVETVEKAEEIRDAFKELNASLSSESLKVSSFAKEQLKDLKEALSIQNDIINLNESRKDVKSEISLAETLLKGAELGGLTTKAAELKAVISALNAEVADIDKQLTDKRISLNAFPTLIVSNAQRLKEGDLKDTLKDIKKTEDFLDKFGAKKISVSERANVVGFFSPDEVTTKTATKELLEAQKAVDVLAISLVKYEGVLSKVLSRSQDSTLSLEAQADALKQVAPAALTLRDAQIALADAEIKLANASIQSRDTSIGFIDTKEELDNLETAKAISQEEASAISSALASKLSAQISYNATLADIAVTRRDILETQFELEEDALIDNTDKLKTIQETIVTDEANTILVRQNALNSATKTTNDAYNKQVSNLIQFQKDVVAAGGTKGVDITQALIDSLLVNTNIEDVNKTINTLGLSEKIVVRVQELIRERQQTVSDLKQLQGTIDLSALNLKFTDADIASQQAFLADLIKQNADIEKQINAIKNNTGPTKIVDILLADDKIRKADKSAEEFADKQLTDDINQAKERLDIATKAGLETLELQKSLDELLLEEQQRFLEKQRKLKEEELDKLQKLADDAAAKTAKDDDTLEKAEIKRLQRKLEIEQAAFSLLNALNDKVANDRLTKIDREIAAVSEREGYLISLAEKGSENLTENLAFEQKKQAELEAERDRIDRARARRALAISVFETYSANLNAIQQENVLTKGTAYPNPGASAISKTAIDASILQALVNALPSFYDGVEDTGNGGGLDDKNGFLAVLHPHERVLTAQQNKSILGYSNEEIVQRVHNVPNNNLEHKIDELIKVTREKEAYLGGDFSELQKTFTEKIKSEGKLIRIHNRTNNIF